MDDEIIPRIKFIGKIQKGEKMNVKHMQVQPDSILTKISRSFIHTDTRSNTYTFVNYSIKKDLKFYINILEVKNHLIVFYVLIL